MTEEQEKASRAFLKEKVDAANVPIFLTSKADIVEYYRDTRGARWKQDIIHDMMGITGKKYATIEKRFDKQRLDAPERKNAGEYKELGEKLPPIGHRPPANGYKVSFTIDFKFSEKCGWIRTKTITISGPDARSFAEDPDIFTVALTYFEGEEEYEDICAVLAVDVWAA